MSIVLNPYDRLDQWEVEFGRLLPHETIHSWVDGGLPPEVDPADVDLLIAWRMPRAALHTFVNLKAILSLGAGAEQWQKEGTPEVPVVRLVDPAMSHEMAMYALAWIGRLHRRFDVAEEQQSSASWNQPKYRQAWQYRVGVLGYGSIGRRIGQAFLDLGYQVNGWTRSGATDAGVSHYAGLDELDSFLANSDAVINVLPSTAETIGLLNAARFAQMPQDSIIVNIGRGTVLIDDDLIAALDDGPLGAAVLDVTDPEPLPADSPLWGHRQVHLTPHVAGSTQVRTAAELVSANVDRIRAGEAPFPLLDRVRGY